LPAAAVLAGRVARGPVVRHIDAFRLSAGVSVAGILPVALPQLPPRKCRFHTIL
jgi:hypothetical protein